MTFLTDWAKSIVYYILFVKVLTSLMPSGHMTKYFKLFSGILLIIILIQPLIHLKSFDEKMFTNIIKTESDVDQHSLTRQANTFKRLNDRMALDLYVKNTKERIRTIVDQTGVFATHVDVKVNEDQKDEHFGEILEITLSVNKKSTASDASISIEEIKVDSQADSELPKSPEDILIEKNIKSNLLDFYNLTVDNIHISIEK